MKTLLLMMPSGYEMIVILLVVVLLFGGKKIPELMRGLGKGMNEFKKATSEVGDIKDGIEKPAVNKNPLSQKKTTEAEGKNTDDKIPEA